MNMTGSEKQRLIVMPVGLSILRNLAQSHNLQLQFGQEASQLQPVVSDPHLDAARLSAEMSILRKIKTTSKDWLVFLATDTDAGECAANANAVIAERLFGLDAEVKRVEGLVLDDADTFLRKGLPNFFNALDRAVEKALAQGREPIIGMAGGIKPVLPYAAIYGMLRRVRLVYVFEMTQALIALPPLPLDFDWKVLERVERALHEIESEVAISPEKLKSILSDDLPFVEGLFEGFEGEVTLSAFGHILLGALRRAGETPIMLSPAAQKKLKSLQGEQRQEIELLLDRVRNPIWRAQKWHTRNDTDLVVWKPGANQPRLAGWVEGDTVYLAEIYPTHEEYDRDIPNRNRDAYNLDEFSAYYPRPLKIPVEDLEEAGGDELLALARRKREAAERDRDEALKLAEQLEEKARGLAEELMRLQAEAEELRARERERRSWGLWRRLRWAIFGS